MITASSRFMLGRWRVTLTDTDTQHKRTLIIKPSDVMLLALTRPAVAALWLSHPHDGSTWTQDAHHATTQPQ